jgi:hypothetical protein
MFEIEDFKQNIPRENESFKTNYDYETATNMDDSNEMFCN